MDFCNVCSHSSRNNKLFEKVETPTLQDECAFLDIVVDAIFRKNLTLLMSAQKSLLEEALFIYIEGPIYPETIYDSVSATHNDCLS